MNQVDPSETEALASLAQPLRSKNNNTNNVKRYLVTCKYSKVTFHSVGKYLSLFDRLKNSIPTGDFGEPRFELDSKSVIHMHFLLSVEKIPYFKKFKGFETGCVIHFQYIKDNINRVLDYINKDVRYNDPKETAELLNMTSYCSFKNLFK